MPTSVHFSPLPLSQELITPVLTLSPGMMSYGLFTRISIFKWPFWPFLEIKMATLEDLKPTLWVNINQGHQILGV